MNNEHKPHPFSDEILIRFDHNVVAHDAAMCAIEALRDACAAHGDFAVVHSEIATLFAGISEYMNGLGTWVGDGRNAYVRQYLFEFIMLAVDTAASDAERHIGRWAARYFR